MGRYGSADDTYSVLVPDRQAAQRVVKPFCDCGHWHTVTPCSLGEYLITVLQNQKGLLDSLVAELRGGR